MTDTQQKNSRKGVCRLLERQGLEKGKVSRLALPASDVYGVEQPEQFITLRNRCIWTTSFIDGAIPSTKVLIEQKGLGKDLNKPIKRSDGTLLTPFQQAKRYITELPLSQHPRWVVT